MNEYWQSRETPSFCFSFSGTWYQIEACEGGDSWELHTVAVRDELPVEMTVHYYDEIDLDAMLGATRWSEADLLRAIAGQTDRVID